MKLTKFVEFIRSELDGTCWLDPTYRAYNLDAASGERLIKRARIALGYSSLRALRSDFAVLGYRGPVVGPLARWYVWEQLRTGRYRTWTLRKGRGSQQEATRA